MSLILFTLALATFLFVQCCSCENSPQTYGVHELSQIIRNFDLKFAEIEAKLEKQTVINKNNEEKIRFQDSLIRSLSKRVNVQDTKILKCEKQVQSDSEYIQSSIHSLFNNTHSDGHEHDRYENTTKGNDKSGSNSMVRLLKTMPNLRKERQSSECAAFSVYLNRNVTNLGPDHTLQHGGVVLNEGNAYNVHTGVFTTPASGVYLFTFTVENYADNRIWVKVVVNGKLQSSVVIHPYPGYRTMGSNAVILRLTAGDSVWVAVDANESGDSFEGSTHIRATTFSGVLLCQ